MEVNRGRGFESITAWKWTDLYRLCVTLLMLTELCQGHQYSGKVLLVGFDGFRWDYLQYADTPNFDRIKAQGTTAPYINNVFTSITFPSMYSIVTGLYPESHGIVGYEMYDATYLEKWTHTNMDPKWWDGGEPIWVTGRRQGLETGAYMWLGSEVEIRGHRPHHWLKYDENIAFKDRVDQVLSWFTQHEVDVAALYFHEPDSSGHSTGPAPQSKQTLKQIHAADDAIGYLLDKMAENGLHDSVNLIVTSDHGMTECDLENRTINVYDYLSPALIQVIADEGAVANILPAEGRTHDVFAALSGAHPNMTVYYKQDVPDRFHFKHHRRIHPIVAIADEGWLIIGNGSWSPPLLGMHGYDTDLMSMKPFFMAMGPNIRHNYTSQVFNQTDIYLLMCELLGIEASPSNGSLRVTGNMLRSTLTINMAGRGATYSQSHTLLLCAALFLSLLNRVQTRR